MATCPEITPEVAGLLAAVVACLDVPAGGRPADRRFVTEMRVAAVRGALGAAPLGADVEGMTRALRKAAVDYPVTYAPFQREDGDR